MAPLLLLTPEQAQHNKKVFERAAAKLPRRPVHQSLVPPVDPSSSSAVANAISIAYEHKSARLCNLQYPPPPASTIFSDPTYHVYALSTFITTAMSTVGFVPNSTTDSASEQAYKFALFLIELQSDTYQPYLEIVAYPASSYSNTSIDCTPLINAVSGFIQEVEETLGATNASKASSEITNMVVSAVNAFEPASMESVELTQFSVFEINGDSISFSYPVATILCSDVYLERHTVSSGKSTTVQESQEIDMIGRAYMINSPVVVAHAAELAAAFNVSSTQFTEAINVGLSLS